jgi:hypothetical protein
VTVTEQEFDASKCGTYAGYHRHRRAGDRPCPACRQAKAEREAAHRQRRLATGAFKHGTNMGWDAGCRCTKCVKFHRRRYKTYYDASRLAAASSAPDWD